MATDVHRIVLEIDLATIRRALLAYVGTHAGIDVRELVTPGFMQAQTRFESIDAMLAESGTLAQGDDWVSDKAVSMFVRENTRFFDVDDMLKIAAVHYFMSRMMTAPISSEAV